MQSPEERAGTIEALLREERRYPPSPEFVAQANMSDTEVYKRAEQDPEGFWREAAKMITWFKEPTEVLKWEPVISLEQGLTHTYNWIEKQVRAKLPVVALAA